jgi:hypothetical protein
VLPILGKELAQLPSVHLPLLVDRVIVSFRGGFPFRFGNPIPIKESGRTALNLQLRSGNPHEPRTALQEDSLAKSLAIIGGKERYARERS